MPLQIPFSNVTMRYPRYAINNNEWINVVSVASLMSLVSSPMVAIEFFSILSCGSSVIVGNVWI